MSRVETRENASVGPATTATWQGGGAQYDPGPIKFQLNGFKLTRAAVGTLFASARLLAVVKLPVN